MSKSHQPPPYSEVVHANILPTAPPTGKLELLLFHKGTQIVIDES